MHELCCSRSCAIVKIASFKLIESLKCDFYLCNLRKTSFALSSVGISDENIKPSCTTSTQPLLIIGRTLSLSQYILRASVFPLNDLFLLQ